jgi:medium-chain acyl-[acyl-carrier-protein] hydrolase
MSPVLRSKWLLPISPSRGIIRLFCLPYAGSHAAVFNMWRTKLPSEIEAYAVQLPGRGARSKEGLHTNLIKLVEDIVDALQDDFDVPFALFGHSMGAQIAFEMARMLRQRGMRQPLHLFVAGAAAPQWPRLEPVMYNATDSKLIAYLRTMQGTPSEVFDNEEMLQVVLPIIRADFEMLDTYVYNQEPALDLPISAFGGSEDSVVPVESLLAWSDHTTHTFVATLFDGGHFFVRTTQQPVIQALSDQLIRTAALDAVQPHASQQ